MLKPLILRVDNNLVSGYNQLINKTIEILKKHYDLIILPVFTEKNNCEGYKKLNKTNWGSPEFYITPISNDGYISFLGDFTVKNNCFLYTMWESSRLTRHQKIEIAPFAKIFVPSNWNKDCFEKNNFKTEVVPCFVDENFFYKREKKDLSKFVFVTGGSNLMNTGNDKRKDFSMLLKVFRKLFKNKKDVSLKIKLSDYDYDQRRLILGDTVEYYNFFESKLEYANFLGECDAFVSVSKAEGWGFMQIESLAVGKPLISQLYSGLTEYANEDNTFKLEYDEDIAFGSWGSGGGMWSNVKEESLEEQLLNVYNKRDEIRHKSSFYSESVISKYSIKKYEENLIKTIENNYTFYKR